MYELPAWIVARTALKSQIQTTAKRAAIESSFMDNTQHLLIIEASPTSAKTFTFPDKTAQKTAADPNPQKTSNRQELFFWQGEEFPDKHTFFINDPADFVKPGKYLIASKPGGKAIDKRTIEGKSIYVLSTRDWILIPLAEAVASLAEIEKASRPKPTLPQKAA